MRRRELDQDVQCNLGSNIAGHQARLQADELYTWRAILGLWDEVQASGSRRDSDRGVLRLETASARFQLFCAQLESRKLAENLHVQQNRNALQMFMEVQKRLFSLTQ